MYSANVLQCSLDLTLSFSSLVTLLWFEETHCIVVFEQKRKRPTKTTLQRKYIQIQQFLQRKVYSTLIKKTNFCTKNSIGFQNVPRKYVCIFGQKNYFLSQCVYVYSIELKLQKMLLIRFCFSIPFCVCFLVPKLM